MQVTIMKNSLESTNLKRIDKNIAQNSVSFNQYESDENLIRNLTIYFSVIAQQREDLFGYITFDPKTFAKDMGYKSTSFLFDVIDEPFQAKRLGAKEYKKLIENNPEQVFKTRMENALYRMFSDPLELKYTGQTYTGDDYVKLRSILLIEEINMIIVKKNKGKKYYKIKFSPLVRDNLTNFFSFMDLTTYVQLPERLKNFYLMLCNVKYNLIYGVKNNFSYSIDDLSLFLGVNDSEVRQRKKHINKAFQEISNLEEKFGLELNWEKNGKFNYKPEFKISESNPPLIPNKKVVFEEILHLEYTTACYEYFNEHFINENGTRDKEEHKAAFIAWIQNPNKNMEDKKKAYNSAAHLVFKDKFKKDENRSYDFIVKYRYMDYSKNHHSL